MVDTPDARTPSAPSVVSAVTEFEILYRREFSALAVLAGTIVGNRSAGEDIAQEALARAHRHWSRVAGLDKPGAWVRRVAINLAIGRKRRIASEARALLKIGDSGHSEAETRRGDPAVWHAVDQLPSRQRAVIALRYLEDLPVAEIADLLEISVTAATSNLHKARRSLARTLGGSHG